MEEASGGANAPLLTVYWAARADLGAPMAPIEAALQTALAQLKRVALRRVDAAAGQSEGGRVPAALRALLPQSQDHLACWLDHDAAAQAWSVCVAGHTAFEPSRLAPGRLLWPCGTVDDGDRALQGVLQIGVLLPTLHVDCDPALWDLMLDALLHAEARLLETDAQHAQSAEVVLATWVAAAWLAMYRIASQAVYLARAHDAALTVSQSSMAALPVWLHVAWRRTLAEVQLLRGLHQQDAVALEQAAQQLELAAQVQATLACDDTWATLLAAAGHALESLAQLRSLDDDWSRAIAAYRSAAQVLERTGAGLLWAQVQSSLGRVLSARGRLQRDADLLLEAVRAFDQALQVYTELDHPQSWGTVQHHSGEALQALGQIQHDPVQLVLALQAFEQALRQRPRTTQASEWANTQHHLASLLAQLGLEQNDSSKLRQAITGFHQALQVRTLSSAPLDWVASQHAMGRAYDALGRRDNAVHDFECAVQAYVLALSQRPRSLAPLDWAVLQFDLGNVWLQLGYRLQQVSALQAAASAYRAALEVFDAQQHSAQWTQAMHSLAAALRRVGELSASLENLALAADTYESLLSSKASALPAHDLAALLESLMACRQRQAAMTGSAQPIEQAIAQLQAHLPTLDGTSAELAQGVRLELAQSWLDLAADHPRADAAHKSIEVVRIWMNNSAQAPGSVGWIRAQSVLASAQTLHALRAPTTATLQQAQHSLATLMEQVSRQSQPIEWARATAHAALCEAMQAQLDGLSEARAAQAVLAPVLALLWRIDPPSALRLERAHALVRKAARIHANH